ncbi:MAG: hypothetical protein QOF40_2647, partial [Actinomycetota bacterium]|nr:hypothetical protein [Actinomycetota bacterium]
MDDRALPKTVWPSLTSRDAPAAAAALVMRGQHLERRHVPGRVGEEILPGGPYDRRRMGEIASRVGRRARALATLTGGLRGDATVGLPSGSDDWAAFLELASAHGLLPAVWVALHDNGRVDLPAAMAAALEAEAPPGRAVPEVVIRRAYDRNVARVARLLGAGVETLDQLAAADVPALPLKGLHTLLAGVWPDPAARTMVDLDILVQADVAPQAFALLRAAGFAE